MVLAALAVAVLAVPVWILYPEVAPEPAYGGKPLSFWLVQLQHGTNQDVLPQAQVAVYQIGSRAVPRLLRMLRAHDSALRSRMLPWLAGKLHVAYNHTNPAAFYPRAWCGLQALGPRAATAIPALCACLHQDDLPEFKGEAAMTLANIGPAAGAAVPSLVRAVTNRDEWVHGAAIWALGQIHARPDVVLPVLVAELRDSRAPNREDAALALGKFGAGAKPDVSVLVDLLKPSDGISNSAGGALPAPLRRQIERSLQQIDPEVYHHVVTNTPSRSDEQAGRLDAN